MSDIDNMLAQAEAGANQVANSGGGAVATRPANAPAAYRPPSLDDLDNRGMTVDHWLKVSEDGLKIKVENDTARLDELKVSIDMTEVTPATVIKYGQPPVYHKTYDGVICADGRTLWQDALAEAARYNQKPYPSADVPMTLEEDVVAKGKTIAKAGERLGYSLSTTNREAYSKFQKQVNAEELRESVVEVNLGYQAKENKNKQTWGIVTFDLVGEKAPD